MTITTKFDVEQKLFFMHNNEICNAVVKNISVFNVASPNESGIYYHMDNKNSATISGVSADTMSITGDKVFKTERDLIKNLLGDRYYTVSRKQNIE